jgi:hypothetical protein
MTSRSMESLKYLMGAHFHQDWDLDGGEVSDTVSSFLNERRDLVSTCADQIDALLAQGLAEGELEAKLDEWGSDYYAGDTDAGYRAWLTEIRRQIRTFLSSTAAAS